MHKLVTPTVRVEIREVLHAVHARCTNRVQVCESAGHATNRGHCSVPKLPKVKHRCSSPIQTTALASYKICLCQPAVIICSSACCKWPVHCHLTPACCTGRSQRWPPPAIKLHLQNLRTLCFYNQGSADVRLPLLRVQPLMPPCSAARSRPMSW